MNKSQEAKNSEFINKAINKHGNRYDYSKVLYIKSSEKVCIICSEHGEFWQRPNDHLQGCGCPKCSRNKKLTKEEFINKANTIHNGKYLYNLNSDFSVSKKIKIICPVHGEFLQLGSKHLLGNGCPKCAGNIKKTTELFILESKIKHGDAYDYSKVNYINDSAKVCIICPKHGEFWQKAGHHLEGHGCPKCAYESQSKLKLRSVDDFIKLAQAIHNNRYIYNKAVYKGSFEKIIITCPDHGDFEQTPASHLSGCGCPRCGTSKGENIIEEYLSSHNIKYTKLYPIPSTVNKSGYIYADFFLPDYNVIIEYNGEQHYRPLKFFGGKDKFNIQIERDLELKRYCRLYNINFLEIFYLETLIEKTLETYLNDEQDDIHS